MFAISYRWKLIRQCSTPRLALAIVDDQLSVCTIAVIQILNRLIGGRRECLINIEELKDKYVCHYLSSLRYILKEEKNISRTNLSLGSNFRYFLMNSEIRPMGLSWQTDHFFCFIIGALAVAFSSISTAKFKRTRLNMNYTFVKSS